MTTATKTPVLRNAIAPGNLAFAAVTVLVVVLVCITSPLSAVTLTLLGAMILPVLLPFTREGLYYRATGFAFLFFVLVSLCLLYAQCLTLPEYEGLSGPRGIGTDDTFYYTQATGDIDMSRDGAVKAYVRMNDVHTYSTILRQCVRLISLYKTPHLLDLLLVNAYVLAFVPLLCVACFRKLASYSYTSAKSASQEQLVYWLAMLHPNFWSDGLILIRDGWTATLLIAAIVALQHSGLFRFALAAIILSYIRLASGITLVLCAIPIAFPVARQKFGKHAPLLLLGIGAIGMATLVYAVLSGYIEKKEISFGRDNYVEDFIARSADNKEGGSILYTISQFPAPLRVPSSFVFFLCAPFVRLSFSNDGIVIPRVVLGSIAGGLNVLLIKWWVQSFMKSWRIWRRTGSSSWIALHAAYIIGIFLLATMSLQMRHKTMLLPLLCILAAHGFKDCDAHTRRLGTLAAASLLVVNLINLLR